MELDLSDTNTDVNPAPVAGVEDGTIHALALQDPFDMGYLAVKHSVAHPEGKRAERIVDTGSVTMDGKPLGLSHPTAARKAGIAMIYQELTLAPDLSVEENVTLGLEQACYGFLRPQADKVAAALELLGAGDISPRQKVQTLTIARQQVVYELIHNAFASADPASIGATGMLVALLVAMPPALPPVPSTAASPAF